MKRPLLCELSRVRRPESRKTDPATQTENISGEPNAKLIVRACGPAGPGRAFPDRDLTVPNGHKLNLRFASRRTQPEMGIHRGACPRHPEPRINLPRSDDLCDPPIPSIPEAQVADPPAVTPSGRASLSMSRPKWNALNACLTNPPSAVTAISWPVVCIRIPTLLER